MAFAGELLEIRGTGFTDAPAANRVDFARASAAGLARTAAGLVVRVPPDAGSGPLTVTTGRGASAPLAGFTYRGLGQLRTGQVAQSVPVVTRPDQLLAEGADLLLDASLLGALIRVGDPALRLPHLASVAPAVGGGAVFWVDDAWQLHRHELATGQEASVDVSARIPDDLAYLQPPASPARLVVIGRDQAGTSLTALDPVTLAEAAPPVPFPFDLVAPPRDLGDGRLAGAARPASGADPLLYAFTLGGAATPLPLDGPLGPTPGVALAAGTTSLGPTAAVGLGDGGVQARAAGGATVRLPPLSPTPVAALALSGDVLVVARTEDGTVVGTDLVTGAAWGLTLPRPTRLAAAAGGVVWIAGEADDVLTAVDGATGQVLARRAAGLAPGAASPLGGAAFLPGDPFAGAAPSLLMVTAGPAALVDWRLGALGPAGVPTSLPPALVAADAAAGRVWVAGGAAVAALEQGVELLQATLPAPAVRALATGGGLLVAHEAGLAFVDQGGVHPLVEDATFPVALAAGADGRVLYVATVAGVDRLLVFDPAALTGGPPVRDEPVPGVALGGAWVDGEAWAFLRDLTSLEPQAARLEPGGFGQPIQRLADDGDALASPNGRTLVTWGPGPFGGGTSLLHLWSLDPAAGFPELASVGLDGAVAGLSYDATGERLYVVTRRPNLVLVLQ